MSEIDLQNVCEPTKRCLVRGVSRARARGVQSGRLIKKENKLLKEDENIKLQTSGGKLVRKV
jgi:hypothetical protein